MNRLARVLLIAAVFAAVVEARQSTKDSLNLPQKTTALEGVPQIRIETTREGAERRELGPSEAVKNRLSIRVADGEFFWASRGDRPLTRTSAGEYTYLTAGEPGRYIRIRHLHDKLTYVEHADTEFGSVTYWGELRVMLGR